MRMPGFTAEAAVYRSRGHYRPGPSRGGPAGANTLVPSARSGRGAGSSISPFCVTKCRFTCFLPCSNHPFSRGCQTCLSDCHALCPPDSNG